MNAKQESALVLANGRADDAKTGLLENARWIIALFRAIERCDDDADRYALAGIGQYVADHGWANIDADLDQMKAELTKLREVAA